MNRLRLEELLESVSAGRVSVALAAEQLAGLGGIVLDFAHLDTHRALRTGLPEVIFGEGKTAEQIARLLGVLAEAGQVAIATRVDEETATARAFQWAAGFLKDNREQPFYLLIDCKIIFFPWFKTT